MCGSPGLEGQVPAEEGPRAGLWSALYPPCRQPSMGMKFPRRVTLVPASDVAQALPRAASRSAVPRREGGAAPEGPPPAQGCGRSADSRSRYVSGARGPTRQCAQPGAAARWLGYFFIRGQLRAQALWAWLGAVLGAGEGRRHPLAWLLERDLGRLYGFRSASIAPGNFCKAREPESL